MLHDAFPTRRAEHTEIARIRSKHTVGKSLTVEEVGFLLACIDSRDLCLSAGARQLKDQAKRLDRYEKKKEFI